jgi:hypothetical protein
MTAEARFDAAPNLKEFRDTRLWFQYAMGGIAGVGLFGAITLFRKSVGAPELLVAAGVIFVATLIALAVVYLKFGKPVVLRQTASGIERLCGDSVETIRYDELFGLRAKWTDVLRNGVYNHTQVKLAFSSEDPGVPVLTYHSTVDYDTLKYNELQEFQCEVAEIVARRMADVMQREGSIKWTAKLSIRPDGLELTKKPGAAPELVDFDRISQWKLDEGLFKLGVDGSRRPVLVEATDQWNFYPGLLLFSQLSPSPSDDASIDEDEPVLIG